MALKEEKPFLGICLGAQMLANHLGAKVGFHPDELAEIGYYPLVTTAEGGFASGRSPITSTSGTAKASSWRSGARLLATSTGAYPNQAFAYGSAIGVQFHPEITYAQVHRWTGPQPRAPRHERRPRAPRAHPGPHRPRAQGARLARPLPVPLGQVRTHD